MLLFSRTTLTFRVMIAFHLNRYMLVDREEDNKTHRPVAPKDVRICLFTV